MIISNLNNNIHQLIIELFCQLYLILIVKLNGLEPANFRHMVLLDEVQGFNKLFYLLKFGLTLMF